MTKLSEIFLRLRESVGPMIGMIAAIYFVYHFIQGDRGILSYLRIQQEVARATHYLDTLRAEKEVLDRRVRLLHPESMDLDMLDERVRAILGFTDPTERILVLPSPAGKED